MFEAPPPSYAALGDSYSSGTGTADYSYDERCRRGPLAFPKLLAKRMPGRFEFTACSGATSGDVRREQLTTRASVVTVTAGGNDAGFSEVLEACARPWPWHCDDELDAARRFIRRELPRRLDRLYAAIRRRSPRALVLVVGYPRIFSGGEGCDAAAISPEEQHALNGLADLLTRRTRERALRRERFDFVDVRATFDGHRTCDPEPWLNGLSYPLAESYHPNAAGQRAYARAIRRFLP